MKRLGSLLLALCLLLMLAVPAGAAFPLRINAPTEGAVVKSPVPVNPDGAGLGPHRLMLEVARGTNALSGFTQVYLMNIDGKMYWDAEGFNPGPYTLRFSGLDLKTNDLVAQGIRNIVLEGPDYSPKVSLSAPATLAGSVVIRGSVVDADLDEWSIEAIQAGGTTTLLASGRDAAPPFPMLIDVGPLADGSYSLRLTARDERGQEAFAERNVTVSNPAPSVDLSLVAVDPVLTAVPITYKSSTPVSLSVTVAEAGGRTVAGGEAQGTAQQSEVAVPVSFRGVAPGQYTATVVLKDQHGRVGTDTFAILVRDPLPGAKLERTDHPASEYMMAITIPSNPNIARFVIERTDSAGTTRQDWRPPSGGRQFYAARVDGEGITTYRVIIYMRDGRIAESEELVLIADNEPPRHSSLSVAPVDGLGLNMRWEGALDTVGIKGYEVMLVEGNLERKLATLGPQVLAYAQQLPEGEYSVYLVAIDLGDHRTNSDLLPFRVQTGAVAMMKDGAYLATDQPGFVEEGRTWVPLRFFAQAFGYTISWDAGKQSATIVDPVRKLTVVTAVGDRWVQINGPDGPVTVEIAAAPRLFGGRMLVPLRALVESFGVRVQWHGETQTVELIGK